MRAGAYGLSLLSNPLNAQVLGALADKPLDLPDLHRAVGLPPQTTLRVYLRHLVDIGVLGRHQEDGFPGGVSYELTDSGRDLLEIGRILEGWLTAFPGRSLSLGEPAAKGPVKALVDGWSTKVLRALAVKPLSLTELDRLIPSVNYPALERRLAAMRSAGQIRSELGPAGSRPYKVTDWLRTAVGPLLAAANWEGSRTPDAAEPFDRLDAEATFLLAIPMLELPVDQWGACHLAIEVPADDRSGVAGVVVDFQEGRPVACRSDKQVDASTEVVGSTAAWLGTLVGRDDGLLIRGDVDLAEAVVTSLRHALFCLESYRSVGEITK
jgi:DNA-binding HxlR family transcriptional regulator